MVINLRWKMYLDYLEAHGADYEQVFVADTRDVIFQGDPFAAFKDHSNYLGYTTEIGLIGKDGFNYSWLSGLLGKDEADKFSDKKIICCGTVIGSVNEMKIFCRMMWDALKKDTVWGHEQAMMNHLVRNNLLPIENLIELDVDSGEIFTNGLIKDNKTRGDFILRGDGGVPAVVHQYDRHAELVRLVDRIYRDRNFQADPNFFDVRSVLEQMIHFLSIDKTDEAARFYMNTLPSGANFGAELDRLLKIWQLVLQRPSTPAVGYLGAVGKLKVNNGSSE